MNFRVGFGYDSHRLVAQEGKETSLTLANTSIPFHKKSIAHSDGDAVIHALCDALLGALALKDIGTQFPDTDPQYKGIDSKLLLLKTLSMVTERSWKINNVDITIILEQPKLAPYIEIMTENLAAILAIEKDALSIKAKTNEKMDAVGQGDAVIAYAIVSLIENKQINK